MRFEVNWPSSIALVGCFAIYLAFKAYTGSDFGEADAAILLSILLGFMAPEPVKSLEPQKPTIREQVTRLQREVEQQKRASSVPPKGLRPPPLPTIAEPFDDEDTGRF